MNEYDILKMNDDEYLEYCKSCKKNCIVWLVIFLLGVVITAYATKALIMNLNLLCFITFHINGVFCALVAFAVRELQLWKREINRFKKECTSHDTDNT